MMENIGPFLLVCPLVFLAGFVDAVAGGGGLISLPAYLIAGLPAHMAIGTNKLSSCMGTALAAWRYAKSGYVPWRLSLCCVVCALAGSNAGAWLTLLIADRALKLIMLVVLPLTGFYVLRSRLLDRGKPPFSRRKTTLIAMAAALLIGAYDGFYGPGTGTFLLLILTGGARLRLDQANGATKVINLSTNISALAVFLINHTVLLPLGLAAGCFSLAGNYLGTRIFVRGGSRVVKPLIILVLAVFFVKTLLEVLGV